MRRVEELGRLSDIKCVFIDLDGTLMHGDKTVTEETLAELVRLQERGIRLVIATGRPKASLPVFPAPVHIDYYISSNGSVIYDHDFQVVYSKCIEPEVLRRVMGCFTRDYLTEFFVHGEVHLDQYYQEHVDDYEVVFSNRRLVMDKGIPHDSFAADWEANNYPCEKINVLFKKPFDLAALAALRERIRQIPGAAAVSGGPTNLEIIDAGVNKATAVNFVAERLGISTAETLGFGDSENDMELLEAVGYGIAMENASGALKAEAAAVTLSNEDDGVAYALRCLIP